MKQYEKVKVNPPKRTAFDLSHEHKLSCNMGDLVPIICQEVVPGDNFRMSYEAIVKLQPTIAPIMHRLNVYAQFFFVPNRLIWDDWEDFITKGQSGDLAPNFPKFLGTNAQFKTAMPLNSLADNLGVPVLNLPNDSNEGVPISQLPFRAYQLIYNDWYRDQNLQGEVAIPTDSANLGVATGTAGALLELHKRCWEKDYFTSALPTAQRGDPVMLPLGVSAPVSGTPFFRQVSDNTPATGESNFDLGAINAGLSTNQLKVENLTADLEDATAITMQDLRTANAIQKWKEALMRFGARYKEVIMGLFGVVSSDSRLDRSEYLGGGKLPIQIAEVVQTSQSDTTPQGTMAGHGLGAGNVTGFNANFEEHGFVIGILSIIPRSSYCNGLPKIFRKFDIFDYATPQFMHLGEEPIKMSELYLDSAHADDDFGYQPRYMDYRCNVDRVSGDFRDSLDYWHMARIFPSIPALNSAFVTCNPDDRIFPVVDPQFKKVLIMGYFNFTAIRPVSKYGEPSL